MSYSVVKDISRDGSHDKTKSTFKLLYIKHFRSTPGFHSNLGDSNALRRKFRSRLGERNRQDSIVHLSFDFLLL